MKISRNFTYASFVILDKFTDGYRLMSDDVKPIRNSTSAQVQVLKSIAQGFAILSAQFMFTTLVMFLLGVTLTIYGLRLTLRAPKQTSRYFKVYCSSMYYDMLRCCTLLFLSMLQTA